jgi:hypothetical protein
MNLNYSKGKKGKHHCSSGLGLQRRPACSARDGQAHMACWPEAESRGARSHGTGRWWPIQIPAMPVTRCSGEGPGSKAIGWWTSFGAVGRKKLTGRMSSVRCGRPEGNDGGGQRPGVVVGSSQGGKVVHGSAVLRVWSRQLERGRSELSTMA